MAKRQKTDSITHLVQIVAKEVYEKMYTSFGSRLSDLEKQMKARPAPQHVDITPWLENIRSSMQKAGGYWTKEEDELLIQEVKAAVAVIAQNHQRSARAIVMRIDDRDVINCNTLGTD